MNHMRVLIQGNPFDVTGITKGFLDWADMEDERRSELTQRIVPSIHQSVPIRMKGTLLFLKPICVSFLENPWLLPIAFLVWFTGRHPCPEDPHDY